MKFSVVFVLLTFSQVSHCQGGWLKWVLGKTKSPFDDGNLNEIEKHLNTITVQNEKPTEPRQSEPSLEETSNFAVIPFELSPTDEKFLADARKLTDLNLSDLDLCQHKIILQLKTECSDLTEDELSKLGVNLLNCQSALEGRRIYPCTSSMTIRECTAAMDPDTWNAYHIMSNRARAVCYAARQQQFRALTQMAVNKLMSSSSQQLGFLKILKQEQEELGTLASQTLGSLTAGQQQLIQQQDYLRASQQQASHQLTSTLRELSRERAASLSNQQELSSLSELVKKTLDEARSLAVEQKEETTAAQVSLMNNIGLMEKQMGEAWQHIESRVEQVLSQQQKAALLQAETLENLSRLNSTIGFLLGVVETSRNQLTWIHQLITSIDSKVGGISTWLLHGGYLFTGMIILSFLQVPSISRIGFLVLVPLNLAVQLQDGTGLNAAGLAILLFFITVVYQTLCTLYRKISGTTQEPQKISKNPAPLQISPIRHFETMEGILDSSVVGEMESVALNESLRTSYLNSSRSSTPLPSLGLRDMDHPSITSILLDKLNESGHNNTRRRSLRLESSLMSPRKDFAPTPSLSISGMSSRSGTPKRLCHGVTVEGNPCRNSSLKDSSFCRFHNK